MTDRFKCKENTVKNLKKMQGEIDELNRLLKKAEAKVEPKTVENNKTLNQFKFKQDLFQTIKEEEEDSPHQIKEEKEDELALSMPYEIMFKEDAEKIIVQKQELKDTEKSLINRLLSHIHNQL